MLGEILELINDQISDEDAKDHLQAMRKAKAVTAVTATLVAPALISAGVPFAVIAAVGTGGGLLACKLLKRKNLKLYDYPSFKEVENIFSASKKGGLLYGLHVP